MMDFLKKMAKPIGAGLGMALLIGLTVWMDPSFAERQRQKWEKPDIYKDPPFDFGQKTKSEEKAILTADDLEQLRWMNVQQLKAIFDGRRQYYEIDNSPEAYEQLRWMTKEQIEAIFGTPDK